MKHFLPGIPTKYRDVLYFSFVSNNHHNNSFVIHISIYRFLKNLKKKEYIAHNDIENINCFTALKSAIDSVFSISIKPVVRFRRRQCTFIYLFFAYIF